MRLASTARVFLALVALLWTIHAADAAEMVLLSDLHFNPTANRELVDRLAATVPEQWSGILAADSSRLSGYGEDSNWKLVASALATLKAQPQPGLVLITGDFLPHQFRARFDAAASDHSDQAFRAFAAKTMQFLGLQLETTFPGVPIVPVLGNNDDICGDYALEPGGPFLADTAPIVARMIGDDVGPAFRRSWSALGNYVIANPIVKDARIVVLNTNFFSLHYKNSCGTSAEGNPGAASLAWLRQVLRQAEAAHQKVWLAYHIPPGIDAFATAQHDACPIAPVRMFAPAYAETFHRLMDQFRGTVTASFAGHVHMNGFRLLGDGTRDFAFVMMNPAISPIFGQNPAFRRASIRAHGVIDDETVYYLANLAAAQQGAAPVWQKEQSFDQAWSLPRFDLSSLETLYQRLGTNADARDRWFQDYAVQSQAGAAVKPADFALYRCVAGHDRAAAVTRCSCGAFAPL